MLDEYLENKFRALLATGGISIGGDKPWDIQVHNKKLYRRLLRDGSLGFGEAYMDGWWDCEHVDEFINRVLTTNIYSMLQKSPAMVVYAIATRLFNLQSISRAFQVAEEHYDLDNDLFEAFLDKNMQYTCGYWKDAKDLDEAQINKMHLICQKLGLKPGMKLLDIGSGWGQLANFAAENYGVDVTGVSVSKEQLKYCQEKWAHNKKVSFIFSDYRNITGKYDRVTTVGMIEAVGYKNYRKFMKVVSSVLKDDGLFLLHTIGGNRSATSTDAWIDKYIFPNGMLPSIKQLASAVEGVFIMEDWHNFGPDYDKTLMAWDDKFVASWPKFETKYGKRFYRMWRYYLLMCAGTFRNRKNQLWQIVFSKNGIPGGFEALESEVLEKARQNRRRS